MDLALFWSYDFFSPVPFAIVYHSSWGGLNELIWWYLNNFQLLAANDILTFLRTPKDEKKNNYKESDRKSFKSKKKKKNNKNLFLFLNIFNEKRYLVPHVDRLTHIEYWTHTMTSPCCFSWISNWKAKKLRKIFVHDRRSLAQCPKIYFLCINNFFFFLGNSEWILIQSKCLSYTVFGLIWFRVENCYQMSMIRSHIKWERSLR